MAALRFQDEREDLSSSDADSDSDGDVPFVQYPGASVLARSPARLPVECPLESNRKAAALALAVGRPVQRIN